MNSSNEVYYDPVKQEYVLNGTSISMKDLYNYKYVPTPFVTGTPLKQETSPTIHQLTYGNDSYQVKELKDRMDVLEKMMEAWSERYHKKLKEHEETVDMLLEALKNATK